MTTTEIYYIIATLVHLVHMLERDCSIYITIIPDI